MAIESAAQTANRLMSPRYKRLARLEAYVAGTQYDGRPHFFNTSRPLLERAPHIVDPIVKKAIRAHIDFVLGEKTWPAITAHQDEGDAEGEIDHDQAEALDHFITELVEHAKVKPAMRDSLEAAFSTGSAIFIGYVCEGRVCVDLVKAGWCTRTTDAAGRTLSLEITYPYLEDYFDNGKGRWVQRAMIYRRVIDATTDTVFLPAIAPKAGSAKIVWVVDATKTTKHDLGFCPVHWYRMLPGCTTVAEVDGRALHAQELDEIDAYNRGLSQRDRAAIYCGDPQMWATGVDRKDFGGAGQTATVSTKSGSFSYGEPDGKGGVIPEGTAPRAAQRKGAGVVWSSTNENAKYGVLTLPGDSLKALDDNVRDLGAKLRSAFAYVEVDIDGMSAKVLQQLSGKALELLYKPQTNYDDKIREDFGDNCLLPLITLLLRICLVKSRDKSTAIYLDGLEAVLSVLEQFERPMGDAEGTPLQDEAGNPKRQWFGPHLELNWPPYFDTTSTDQGAFVTALAQLLDMGLITKAMALEMLRSERIVSFTCTVDEMLEQIEKEAAERKAKAMAAMPPGGPPPQGDELQQPGASKRVPPGANGADKTAALEKRLQMLESNAP